MPANLSTVMVQIRKKFEEWNQHIKAKLGSEQASLPANPCPFSEWLSPLMTLPDLEHCHLPSGSLVSQVTLLLEGLGGEWAEVLRKPALLWMFIFVTSKRQTQGHSHKIRWQS